MAILKKGLAGEPVRRLQAKLGVDTDGEFGHKTEAALKEWQKSKGLVADGVAGPDTFIAMGLHELVMLKQGTHGEAVKRLQAKLGITADGEFGPGTAKAVRNYQTANGLTVDGIAGPATLAKMELFKEITPATVKASQVPASTVSDAAGATKTAAADAAAGARSIWDTIKSVFK